MDEGVYTKEAVVGTVRRSVPIQDQHQMFRGVFEDWQTRAGALSALPDAPVVPDEARQGQTAWRRLRTHFGRTAGARRAVAIDWPAA